MKRNQLLNRLIAGIAVGTAMVPLYRFVIRPWHTRWGATDAEIARVLPGDELVPAPKLRVTHAITINAPARAVWPWLVQMGQGRGGMYSYDVLENLLGLNFQSADRVMPDLQDLKVGDVLPLAPGGIGPSVAALEPERTLVLHGDSRLAGAWQATNLSPGGYMAVVWTFVLVEGADGTTRLVERFMLDFSPSAVNRLVYSVMMEPGSFIMERKMLLGIKARAERLAHGGEIHPPATAMPPAPNPA